MSKDTERMREEEQEQRIAEILGTKKFIVLCHVGSVTRLIQGDVVQYEAYGLLRIAEALLDLQTVEIARASEKGTSHA